MPGITLPIAPPTVAPTTLVAAATAASRTFFPTLASSWSKVWAILSLSSSTINSVTTKERGQSLGRLKSKSISTCGAPPQGPRTASSETSPIDSALSVSIWGIPSGPTTTAAESAPIADKYTSSLAPWRALSVDSCSAKPRRRNCKRDGKAMPPQNVVQTRLSLPITNRSRLRRARDTAATCCLSWSNTAFPGTGNQCAFQFARSFQNVVQTWLSLPHNRPLTARPASAQNAGSDRERTGTGPRGWLGSLSPTDSTSARDRRTQ